MTPSPTTLKAATVSENQTYDLFTVATHPFGSFPEAVTCAYDEWSVAYHTGGSAPGVRLKCRKMNNVSPYQVYETAACHDEVFDTMAGAVEAAYNAGALAYLVYRPGQSPAERSAAIRAQFAPLLSDLDALPLKDLVR